MQQVVSQPDRCVFKKDDKYYKVFFSPEDGKPKEREYAKLNDYQREAFIGTFLSKKHTNKDDHIMKTLDTQYNTKQPIKDEMVTTAQECATKIQGEKEPLPLVVTQDTGGQDLYEWIEAKKQAIDKKVIKKFAFQMAWILGEMHSQFGIQHNDIQEMNIKVKEVKTVQKPLVYKLQDDIFEIELEIGDLEVILIDFGSATLKKQQKYNINPEPWENSFVAVLQINNCPEAFFLAHGNKKTRKLETHGHSARNSESDLFMLGHVLLTMHLHRNYKSFEYKKYQGVHVYNIKEEAKILDAKWNTSKLANAHANVFQSEEIRLNLSPKMVDMFFINLIALNVALQGKDAGKKQPPYASDNLTQNVQEFYQQIENNMNVKNYIETHFENLLSVCGGIYDRSFLSKIMNFDLEKRCGPKKYSLTGYLFHPYFAEFYKGYKGYNSSVGAIVYTVNSFLPPLEYNDAGNKENILDVIEKEEEAFNTIYLNQKKEFDDKSTAAPAPTVPAPTAPTSPPSPPPSPKPAIVIPAATVPSGGLTEDQKTTLKECITFIDNLQNPDWVQRKGNKGTFFSITEDKLKIMENTTKCIDLAFELANGNEDKLKILASLNMVNASSKKRIPDIDQDLPNVFNFLSVIEGGQKVFSWVNMASNGAWLAAGLYAMLHNFNLNQIEDFKTKIEAIKGGSYQQVVQTQNLTRNTLKEFWAAEESTAEETKALTTTETNVLEDASEALNNMKSSSLTLIDLIEELIDTSKDNKSPKSTPTNPMTDHQNGVATALYTMALSFNTLYKEGKLNNVKQFPETNFVLDSTNRPVPKQIISKEYTENKKLVYDIIVGKVTNDDLKDTLVQYGYVFTANKNSYTNPWTKPHDFMRRLIQHIVVVGLRSILIARNPDKTTWDVFQKDQKDFEQMWRDASPEITDRIVPKVIYEFLQTVKKTISGK